MPSEELIQLYQQMADLTAPKCAQCRAPHSCCDSMYCYMAIEIAGEQGTVLQKTDHPTLPLMGPGGCTAAPHHRPLCTLHNCNISSLGFDKTDSRFTKQYFKIRSQISQKEDQEA